MLIENKELTLEESKKLYKGITIKDKGFLESDNSQFLFLSELKKKSKIGFYVKGGVYILSDSLKHKLELFLTDAEKYPLPENISYSNERFKISMGYLQYWGGKKTEFEIKTPIIPKEESTNFVRVETNVQSPPLEFYTITTNNNFDVSHSLKNNFVLDILNKVAQQVEKYKIIDSLEFYKSIGFSSEEVLDILSDQVEQLKENKGSVEQVILTTILYSELNKK